MRMAKNLLAESTGTTRAALSRIYTHARLRSGRIVASLFVALALVQLVPIWSVHYLPTTDGPEHLYNSWVLHGLVTGTAPPFHTLGAVGLKLMLKSGRGGRTVRR